MKQLKVIVPSYTSTNGIFQASFKDSFTIDPESRIMFDKISFTISNGNVTGLTIPSQTVKMNAAANLVNSVIRNVFVQGKTYPTLSELMLALNVAYNKVLNSGPLTPIVQGNLSDLGLALYNTVSTDQTTKQITYTFAYNQALVVPAETPVINNLQALQFIWSPAAAGEFHFYSPKAILMGALSASCCLYTFDSATTTTTFQMGLTNIASDTSQITFGIQWDGTTMSIVNNGVATDTIPNPSQFDNSGSSQADQGLRCYWFISDGELRFALVDQRAVSQNAWTYLYISPLGSYPGYDVNTPLYFKIFGDASSTPFRFTFPLVTHDPLLVQDNHGSYVDLTRLTRNTYISTPPPLGTYPPWNPPLQQLQNRSIALDFTDANTLLNGLGFSTPLLQSISNVSGTITGSIPVGFINNQELELDIFDMPLDSYISNPQASSGRVNCVTFFTPVLLNPNSQGSAQFLFENKNMPFINIKNKFPQVIETLSFRLFNPVTPGYKINFQNISFNMYIQSPSDGMPIAFA